MELKTEEKIAFGKAKHKNDSKELKPGKYQVQGLYELDASFKKGEDYDAKPTSSIPFKKVVALLIQYAGITREAALTHLESAMRDAIEGEKQVELNVIEEAEQRIQDLIDKLPKTKRSGRITFDSFLIKRIDEDKG